jgi:hypothetical protein
MSSFSRQLARQDPLRIAGAALGIAIVLFLAAYVFAVSSSGATTSGVLAAAGLVGIAGSGLLYAWRLGAGGVVD